MPAFDALGDPTRRAIFELLADGARPVGEPDNSLAAAQPSPSTSGC